MLVEYRIIFTAIFATEAERDTMYDALKEGVVGDIGNSAIAKRADMTKDQYAIPSEEDLLIMEHVPPVSEKVI